MKLKGFVVLVILFLTSICYGYSQRQVVTENVVNSSDSTTISVPYKTAGTSTTVWTKSFDIGTSEYLCVSYKVEGSSADVGIELEQSYTYPSSEGSSDATFVEPTNAADVATGITTESTWYHIAYSPVALRYGRFKLTGATNNNSDTTVQMKISKQLE